MQPFTERVLKIILSIPKGRVMSYGQIAGCAGNPRAARQVVRVLYTLSDKYSLPWHRVVNAKGEIVIKEDNNKKTQRDLLEAEGVTVINNRIPLQKYNYYPTFTFEEY
ncbi:methylated-DNA-protein-cysteine methyltransferase related protein [Halobacillus dabanensis]|uniref:Methylated-DNA-protein-cysteine methyltransferase related protein n=1 Tax=Halobacillus dabanensis TaxID=240302 RepID=A0A1I3ZAN0_HALDA|nr:MGMT family protein [Halobacillus dabanensis]SFK41117.1 methylated-DNA-protein-cysteine methyltransferase related protein [Halobacillus dabanensis]